ncbi:chemotaxis protein CheB [Colwellia sp. MB3u-4]|uniref:chemotaxis protein CheB n=1 Tax=Colwellia sp. MB3u-4 TaxID=2759822 RepID=UPI0015F6F64A|nr:chemotaxis protein CheB [Colwellia sp. MB3u-4]MBA6288878.1 PAS domain-containing protein [Colwellia sp. MB3u-4]
MKNKIKITKPSTASDSRRLNALKKPSNIVGIGASAGGLEALEDFFTQVQTPSDMAFVVIQHLDPSRTGIMAELLQRTTQMIVKEARNHMKVQGNCVYVIPPNKDLSILHGSLFLFEPVLSCGLRLPIDFFFRSLASDQREHAVAVILSGMGSDGTLGLHAIKQNAGLSLAQSPEFAKFASMPQSAINAELIDIVAPAKELPEHILSGLKHGPRIAPKDIEPRLEIKSKSTLEQIVIILRERTGNDFSLYKKNTIYRRIERRMDLHQLENIALYARYLRENPQEQDLLFKELLIGVTHFFRDKDVWAQLKSSSLPALLENYPEGKELRAWVTACSTGEEAYSLAMTMMDVLDELRPKARFKLQIFATDLDEDAINIARQGFYPASIEADITPTQLARYFIKDDRGYRINKKIRDMIIFAPQNIIMDPPFTKLDIVTCRNLLIYLGPELQKKLIPLFHYALNSHGILMLGNAETIGNFTHLFLALNDSARIFTRIDISKKRMDVDFPSRIFPVISLIHNEPKRTRDMSKDIINLQTQADQILLQNYSPAAVLVNAAGDIMYINGRTGKYLEASAGKANWNIHVMAHEELLMHLNLAMKKAQTQEAPVIIENLMVGKETINLTVQAIAKPKALMGLLMVVFTKVLTPTAQLGKKRGKAAENNQLELQHARDEIEATREQMQAAQEELRSTNEELQSTNEELQSTNEELTTSKEEMQSMNEELQTVNTELQSKVDDLSWVNNDMKNLLNSTEIATIFLDNGLRVRRFTNYATHLFKLIPSDVGRPLSDIVTELDYTSLQKDAREVLDTLVFIEKEITASNNRWFRVRIMPYATQENVIDGVVITFTDISEAKLLESQLRKIKPTI